MAATGFTPISLYYTTTAAAVPVNTNLVAGELALNTTDEKLYFKNAAGTVKLLAANLTPVANGGTGAATLAANNVILGNGTSAVQVVAPGTSGNVLTSNGTTWASTTPVAGGDVTLNGVQTLTNKRIDPRVSTAASAASITPDVASFDQYCLTAQAAALAVNAPTGTPVNGTKLIFRFLDNGTARAITWNATYTVIGVTLPTTTVINKTTYVGCIYNANNTRWDVIAVTTQA